MPKSTGKDGAGLNPKKWYMITEIIHSEKFVCFLLDGDQRRDYWYAHFLNEEINLVTDRGFWYFTDEEKEMLDNEVFVHYIK